MSRPKNAIVAVMVLVVLLLASTFSLYRVYFSTLSPAAVQVYSMGLLGTFLVTLCPLAILWFLDRREPESRWLYVIAFLWGALIASGIAFPVNNIFFKSLGDFVALHPDIKGVLGEDAVMLLTAPIAGPLVEETAKGLGVLLLFWLSLFCQSKQKRSKSHPTNRQENEDNQSHSSGQLVSIISEIVEDSETLLTTDLSHYYKYKVVRLNEDCLSDSSSLFVHSTPDVFDTVQGWEQSSDSIDDYEEIPLSKSPSLAPTIIE